MAITPTSVAWGAHNICTFEILKDTEVGKPLAPLQGGEDRDMRP